MTTTDESHSWWQRWRQLKQPPSASATVSPPVSFQGRWARFLFLRPYGDQLLTPAVIAWLGFAWIIILLMASIEGVVWGLVGASMVPEHAAHLRPYVGVFMFVLMFAVIWIVDASLILSERPTSHQGQDTESDKGAQIRWIAGLAVRVLIVGVSLYVTAPFMEKLIRADDIEHYHQRQVERYFTTRDAELQARIDARLEAVNTQLGPRLTHLDERIVQIDSELRDLREFRARIDAQYAPELIQLRTDLADARARYTDEILGRGGRPEGYGPQAQLWEERAEELTQLLATKQAESDAQLGNIGDRITELDTRLRELDAERRELREEYRQRSEQIHAQERAQQPEAVPPRLTFAARSHALGALRDSPEERGVPHFERVDGFAQAALGVLFFSLLALKLFEPQAVRAYFSETIQYQYRKYLSGGLEQIPGFELPKEPAQRLNPVEFARQWQRYEASPEMFYADQQSLHEVSAPVLALRTQNQLDDQMAAQRHEQIAHEVELLQQRRALELMAYQRELELRTASLKQRLEDDNAAERSWRERQIEQELAQAREGWIQEQAKFSEREIALALKHEERQMQDQELERYHQQRLAELRHAEEEQQRQHQLKLAEQQARREEQSARARLTQWHEERERMREQLDQKLATRVQRLKDLTFLDEKIVLLTDQLRQFNETTAARLKDSVAEGDNASELANDQQKTKRRELVIVGKAARAEQRHRLQDDLATAKAQRIAVATEINDTETQIEQTQTRLRWLEDKFEVLLG